MATLTKSFMPFVCGAAVLFGIAATNLIAQERRAPASSPPAARPAAQPRSQPASQPRTSTERSSAPRREASEGRRSNPGTNADQQPGRRRPEGSPASGQASGGRDRGDRPAVGTAAPRGLGPRPPRSVPPGYNYYYPYWYGGGLGYYYDPYWGGYSSYGYGYPYGYGSTYGYGSAYGSGSTYGSGYGYPSYQSGYGEGGIRLKVKPRDAQVFVDGYFAGVVDSFDGAFQKLTLPGGPHRIELRAPGCETLTVDVRIYSDETITYRGELRPVRP